MTDNYSGKEYLGNEEDKNHLFLMYLESDSTSLIPDKSRSRESNEVDLWGETELDVDGGRHPDGK